MLESLGPNFKDLPVSEQINRLVELHSEHSRRLSAHDAQHLKAQDGLRELTTDLADCRRQYAKYCVKVSGRGVPKPVTGEDTCSVLWTLMQAKYGLAFSETDRTQVGCRVISF